jgi:hypothetical protein
MTGKGKLVLQGGYSRTYDSAFVNLAGNVGQDFPFRKTDSPAPRTPIPSRRCFSAQALPRLRTRIN